MADSGKRTRYASLFLVSDIQQPHTCDVLILLQTMIMITRQELFQDLLVVMLMNYKHATAESGSLWICSARTLKTRKNALDRGRTDRISLTHDLELQSLASYGHDLPACVDSVNFRKTVNVNKSTSDNTHVNTHTRVYIFTSTAMII